MNSISRLTPRCFQIAVLLTLFLAVAGRRLDGHAILKSSSPANGGSVTQPDMPVTLTFNVRIDAARSKLQLLMPDASTVDLPIGKSPSADRLVSSVTGLRPGAYAIRWQVLAPDGHISRGEIPFTVSNP
jgi:methionine-rich copper-binding protein CopC